MEVSSNKKIVINVVGQEQEKAFGLSASIVIDNSLEQISYLYLKALTRNKSRPSVTYTKYHKFKYHICV